MKRVVTNLAVIDITPEGFYLKERAPQVEVEEIIQATEGLLIVPNQVPEMILD